MSSAAPVETAQIDRVVSNDRIRMLSHLQTGAGSINANGA
jgi:hypothetical protein